jgi:hypothetical protein
MYHPAETRRADEELRILAAVKRKMGAKKPVFGDFAQRSALFSYRLTRGSVNCKTFMRRFDPDPHNAARKSEKRPKISA